ncbi:hypothetical protein Esi_0077_0018 [Ectocarpus siliculosus]|uniref:Uncharacterized protein n=1 Tax=Ectocarpus siliculosus TaxID=2880 RepID=D8LSV2_ECTSI|nr:hypothetical protein Esi_0077_0018 [Ectocarpus siliculosus]|eukprot:CBN77879.1 hypothetical protein Esi_0077_0018 [Ectocarpus siliculosus]
MSSGDNGVSNDSGSTSSAGAEVGGITVAIKALLEMDDGEEKRGEDEHGEEKEEQRAQEERREEEDISRISFRRRQAAAISEHWCTREEGGILQEAREAGYD